MPVPVRMVTPDMDGVIREAIAEAMEPMGSGRDRHDPLVW
jgi:hypothetical protein